MLVNNLGVSENGMTHLAFLTSGKKEIRDIL